MPKDLFGKEIQVGDWMCYGFAMMHSPRIAIGKVEALKEDKVKLKTYAQEWKFQKLTKRSKSLWIKETELKSIILEDHQIPEHIKEDQ